MKKRAKQSIIVLIILIELINLVQMVSADSELIIYSFGDEETTIPEGGFSDNEMGFFGSESETIPVVSSTPTGGSPGGGWRRISLNQHSFNFRRRKL